MFYCRRVPGGLEGVAQESLSDVFVAAVARVRCLFSVESSSRIGGCAVWYDTQVGITPS